MLMREFRWSQPLSRGELTTYVNSLDRKTVDSAAI
jgi:hypothetical protein